jgi:hypothetical protein
MLHGKISINWAVDFHARDYSEFPFLPPRKTFPQHLAIGWNNPCGQPTGSPAEGKVGGRFSPKAFSVRHSRLLVIPWASSKGLPNLVSERGLQKITF